MEDLFSGYALGPVDADGWTTLPPFVLRVLERRRAGPLVLFGIHETDPCISGYDEHYLLTVQEETERRRLRDEAAGLSGDLHRTRVRRLFGAVARSGVTETGRIALPPMMRRRSGIGRSAFFVGTGGSFEIWDPEVARQTDTMLGEMADFAVLETQQQMEGEETP